MKGAMLALSYTVQDSNLSYDHWLARRATSTLYIVSLSSHKGAETHSLAVNHEGFEGAGFTRLPLWLYPVP